MARGFSALRFVSPVRPIVRVMKAYRRPIDAPVPNAAGLFADLLAVIRIVDAEEISIDSFRSLQRKEAAASSHRRRRGALVIAVIGSACPHDGPDAREEKTTAECERRRTCRRGFFLSHAPPVQRSIFGRATGFQKR